MIITRTPLRISLGGGGTDVPSFYRTHGHGFLIAAAITKYVYIAINQNFSEEIFLKYSEIERSPTVEQIRHPLLRECLRMAEIKNRIEVTSMADVPAGTGLGSSGAFAVGTLKALHLFAHRTLAPESIAEQACQIEIEKLGEATGKQDQYIAALGGITALTFRDDESVGAEKLAMDEMTRLQLEDGLLLFYTNIQRSAATILASETANVGGPKMIASNLLETRMIGYETRDLLMRGDLRGFGKILTEQWKLKYLRQPTSLHAQIDLWIEAGIAAGASGGKLVGAGGGGFLLFYAQQKMGLRKAMADIGLPEVRFGIDYEGSSVTIAR